MLGPNGAGKTSLMRSCSASSARRQGRVRIDGKASAPPPLAHRLRPAAACLRPRRRPARPRSGAARARRPPFRLQAPVGSRSRRIDRALADARCRRVRQHRGGTAVGRRAAATSRRAGACPRPGLLLADEPLLSLDLAYQRIVVDLLDHRRRQRGTPLVFVTHDINPVLHAVDAGSLPRAGRAGRSARSRRC